MEQNFKPANAPETQGEKVFLTSNIPVSEANGRDNGPLLISTGGTNIFSNVDDRETPLIDTKTSLTDAEGNTLDNLGDEDNKNTDNRGKRTLLMVAVAVVVIVFILKSK